MKGRIKMKKFKTAVIVLSLTVLLSGCAIQGAESVMSEVKSEVKVAEGVVTELQKQETNQDKSGSKEEAKQREQADFTGEISQMIGNELTLKLVDIKGMPQMPQRAETPENDTSSGEEAEKASERTPKAITGNTNSGFPGGGGGGGFPGGGFPGEGRTTGTNAGTGRSSTAATLSLDYTGEEKTVTIPVGMNIAGGRGQSEATFESLQVGSVISIWLDDKNEVESARLIGGGTQ
ncbi:MAG: hypothetical protein K0R69_2259 [Clostridia bacterium]|jgi:hypothetical protein|nr:hypothetical protein [Clostridia bacterium]